MKLRELAARLDCRLEGDGTIEIVRVAKIEQAGPGDVTFLANPKYASALAGTGASAVIVADGVDGAPCAVLRSDNPYLAFARAAQALMPSSRPAPGVHATALVAPDAVLGAGVSVGPYAIVGAGTRLGDGTIVHPHAVIGAEVVLGPDCVVHARVSIHDRCQLGARVVLKDGAVIGSEGFGFATRADGTHERIPQTAPVVLEDDVEVGANSCIDRPAVGETRVRAGTKIDNLVQIAHGVRVGTNAFLAAQVGVAGSSVIGDSVMLGGQVGVTGHVVVGDRVKMSAKTGVTGNVPDDAFLSGYPSMDNLEWRKAFAVVRKLPEFRRRLAAIERRLAALDDTGAGHAQDD
ncbi:MAG: UDP-3-O-(3-hydroxymyristoyl)glucosamine N-acyltransferase [Vicinamibacterales bacterium]